MKIIKFNESYTENDWYNQKFYKITFKGEIIVPANKIENYKFREHYNENDPDSKRNEIFAGIDEYLYNSGDSKFSWELVDSQGDKIENEELFDTANKFNI